MFPSLFLPQKLWATTTLQNRYSILEEYMVDSWLIHSQAQGVSRAFTAQRKFLLISTKAKKPDQSSPAFQELTQGLLKEMGHVGEIKDKNRNLALKDHFTMVADGMGALQWVVIEPSPIDWVSEVLGGVQMFGNRVLKEYREKCADRDRSIQ